MISNAPTARRVRVQDIVKGIEGQISSDGLLSRVDLTCGQYMYVDGGGCYMWIALFNAQPVKTAE